MAVAYVGQAARDADRAELLQMLKTAVRGKRLPATRATDVLRLFDLGYTAASVSHVLALLTYGPERYRRMTFGGLRVLCANHSGSDRGDGELHPLLREGLDTAYDAYLAGVRASWYYSYPQGVSQ